MANYSDYIHIVFNTLRNNLTNHEKYDLFKKCFSMEKLFRVQSNKHNFCEKIVWILKNRFLNFKSNNSNNINDGYNQLAGISKINHEIIQHLLKSSNSKSLLDDLSDIFENISSISKEPTDSDITSMDNNNHNSPNFGKYCEMEERSNSVGLERFSSRASVYGGLDRQRSLQYSRSTSRSTMSVTPFVVSDQMSFEQQFCDYFTRLSGQSNVAASLKTFLTILFLEVGIFWKIRNDMTDDFVNARQHGDGIVKKFGKDGYDLVDVCICDNFGQSLYHVCATYSNNKVFDELIKLDSNIVKFKNKLDQTPNDEAIKHGNWSIVQQMALVCYLFFFCVCLFVFIYI